MQKEQKGHKIYKQKKQSKHMTKRHISLLIPLDLYKQFSKKCIDLNKTKTKVLIELIENFLK